LEQFLTIIENILHNIIHLSVLVCECIAAGVLITSAIKEFYHYIHKRGHVVLNISKKINVALVFKLVAVLLHLLVATDYKDVLMVGMVVIIHGAISFLIHWEIAHDHSNVNPKDLEDVNL